MIYALWDVPTHTLIGEFDTMDEAMRFVLDGIAINGPDDTERLGLSIEDEHGDTLVPAQDLALAKLARNELAIPA